MNGEWCECLQCAHVGFSGTNHVLFTYSTSSCTSWRESRLCVCCPHPAYARDLGLGCDIQHPKGWLFFSPHFKSLASVNPIQFTHAACQLLMLQTSSFCPPTWTLQPPPQSHHSLLLDLILTASFFHGIGIYSFSRAHQRSSRHSSINSRWWRVRRLGSPLRPTPRYGILSCWDRGALTRLKVDGRGIRLDSRWRGVRLNPILYTKYALV